MLNIVANLLEYKIADKVDHADKRVRDDLHSLYTLIHNSELEEIAANKGVSGSMPHQIKAQMGHLFVKNIFAIIDELYANHDSVSLGEILETLIYLNKLISDNQFVGYAPEGYPDNNFEKSPAQFSQVVQFIGLLPGGSANQRKQLYQKAISTIHKVHRLVKNIIEQITEIADMNPDAVEVRTNLINIDDGMEDLGKQQIAMAPVQLLNKFVRIWGPQVFKLNPTLDQMSELSRQKDMNGPLTSFLNSLNRGGGGGEYSSIVIPELKKIMDPYLGSSN